MQSYAFFGMLFFFLLEVKSLDGARDSITALFGRIDINAPLNNIHKTSVLTGLLCQTISLTPKLTFFNESQGYYSDLFYLRVYPQPQPFVFVSPNHIGSSSTVVTEATTAFFLYHPMEANRLDVCVRNEAHANKITKTYDGNTMADWMVTTYPPFKSLPLVATFKNYACKWLNGGLPNSVVIASLNHLAEEILSTKEMHYDTIWLEESADFNKICWTDTRVLQKRHAEVKISLLVIPSTSKKLAGQHLQKEYLVGRQKATWPTDPDHKGGCFNVPFSIPFSSTPFLFVTAEMKTGGFHNPITAWVDKASERGMTACVSAMYWTDTTKFAGIDVHLHFLAFTDIIIESYNNREITQKGYGILTIVGPSTQHLPSDVRNNSQFLIKFTDFLTEITNMEDLHIVISYGQKYTTPGELKLFFELSHPDSSEAMQAINTYVKKSINSGSNFTANSNYFSKEFEFFNTYFYISAPLHIAFEFSGICVKGKHTAGPCSTSECGNPGTQIINYPTLIDGFGIDLDTCPAEEQIVSCNEEPCLLEPSFYPLLLKFDEKLVQATSPFSMAYLLVAVLSVLVLFNLILGLIIWLKLRLSHQFCGKNSQAVRGKIFGKIDLQ